MLGFLFFLGKFRKLPGETLLGFVFFTWVPKNGPKFKKRQKMTKTISPLLGDPIYRQKFGGKSFYKKVVFVVN